MKLILKSKIDGCFFTKEDVAREISKSVLETLSSLPTGEFVYKCDLEVHFDSGSSLVVTDLSE